MLISWVNETLEKNPENRINYSAYTKGLRYD